MTHLRAGVIGLGVGEEHAATYDAHADCELVALCDIDETRLAEVHARFPDARTTTDASELLTADDIDVVSIASYDDRHADQVLLALENGKHVFVEKPLCLHREEAEQIRAALARHTDLVLTSNLVLRASPRFRRLRELIGEGGLGRVYYAEADYDYGRLHKITEGWRGDLPYYSVMLGGGVHVVDLLLWLSGERVVEVMAYGNRIASEGTKFRFDDLVVGLLRFESGALGKVGANFGSVMPHFHAMQLFGTDGTFVNGSEHATLFTRDGETRIDDAYPGVPKGALIPSFVDAVLGRGQAAVSVEEIFTTLDVCFAIEDAVRIGRPVAVGR